MKLLPLLFLLLFSCHEYRCISDAEYVYNTVKKYNEKHSERYTFCIIYYSAKYDLDPKIVTRLIREETHFKHGKISPVGARGAGQVRPAIWSHLLYRIDCGDLGRYIIKQKIKDTKRFYHRIGYGIELSCIVLKHYLDKHGSYPLALLYYHMSRDSKSFWKYKNGERDIMKCKYIRNIMRGE